MPGIWLGSGPGSNGYAPISVVEIAILQALLEDQRGQKSAAVRYLHTALVLGEQNGYVRSFIDEGKPMAVLLSRYAAGMAEAAGGEAAAWAGAVSEGYVRRLLDQFQAAQKETPPAPSSLLKGEQLSRNETDLLRLIQQGASNKEIAAELVLSEGTVKVYLSRLYEKLGVSSRTQALVMAQRHGLLPLAA